MKSLKSRYVDIYKGIKFNKHKHSNVYKLSSRGSSQPRTESPSPAQQVDSFTTVLSEQTDKILNSVKYLIYVKISLFFAKICHYREVSGKVKHNLTLFILLFSGIEILEVLIWILQRFPWSYKKITRTLKRINFIKIK